MKHLKIFLSASLLFSINTFSQTLTFTKVWEKVYGGARREVSNADRRLFLTPDSNLLLVANFAESNVSGNKITPNCGGETAESDIWVIKVDQQGNKIWDKTYGGLNSEVANAAFMESDGSVLIGGSSNSDSSCEKSQDRYDTDGDYWVIKIDSAGNKIWDRRYGWNNPDILNDIVKINGGYLLVGNAAYLSSNLGGDVTDSTIGVYDNFWVVKIDSAGNKVADNMYGGYLYTRGFTGATDSNQNYYFAGATSNPTASGDISSAGFGASDGWLIKTDSNGIKMWDTRFGGNKTDAIQGLSINSSGNLVLVANSQFNSSNGNITDTVSHGQMDILLVMINTDSGSILIQKRLGSNFNDIATQVIEMSDKGYIVLAYSNSNAGFEKSQNTNGDLDFWLIRTDSMFNVIWDKTIGGNSYEGVPSVVFLNDSTFVIAGQSSSDVSGDKTLPLYDTINSGVSAGDIWIMKYVISTPTSLEETLAAGSFTIHPNPVSSRLNVRLPYTALILKHVNTVITDVTGRTVYTMKFDISTQKQIPIDVSSLHKGIYFIRIGNGVRKFVKM